MVLAPVLVGTIVRGPHVRQVVLIGTWVLAYLAYQCALGWLRSWRRPSLGKAAAARRRPASHDYVLPACVYGALALVGAICLVIGQPRLLAWAPIFAVPAVIGVVAVLRRKERTLVNGGVQIAASVLMAVVVSGVGGYVLAPGTSQSLVIPPGLDDATAWLITLVCGGYFGGTLLYVKTLIRERGVPSWYIASVIYHAAGAILVGAINPVLGGLGVIAFARAAAIPRFWPQARPRDIGLGEIFLTCALTVALCLTLAR
jgi:hypothetical protein